MTNQIDENLLVEKAQQGSKEAFTKLMDKYKSSVFHTILKTVNNVDDAEDLTMVAFEKAFKKLNTYTDTYAFSTWLYKIASNTCVDFLRKKQIHNNVIDSNNNSVSNIQSTIDNPETDFINKQMIGNIKKVLDQLRPRYKELIELRYFKEYTYEEISEELSIPIGTVKVQLHRAKKIIYNLLKTKK